MRDYTSLAELVMGNISIAFWGGRSRLRRKRWPSAAADWGEGGRRGGAGRSSGAKQPRFERFLLLFVPFIDVVTEVGIASAFPQWRELFGSSFRASVFLAVGPLAVVAVGWVWGGLAKRFSLSTALSAATIGWASATLVLGFFVINFGAALALRAAQGCFAAGFAALPFVGFTVRNADPAQRTKHLGHVEVAVSAGAIAAPVGMGTALAIDPAVPLFAAGTLVLLIGLGSFRLRRPAPEPEPEPKQTPERAGAAPLARSKLYVLVPTAFAAITALHLGALEALIPTVGERFFGSVAVGKGAATAFELAVVCGILLKARREGPSKGLPIVLSGLFLAVWAFSPSGTAALALLVFIGIPVGAQVTLGNEIAARSVGGFEEKGMGVYSTLRVSGSFAGPLFMNFGFPWLLLALAAVSAASVFLVRP